MKLLEWREFNQPLLEGIDDTLDLLNVGPEEHYIRAIIPYASLCSHPEFKVWKDTVGYFVDDKQEMQWFHMFNVGTYGRYTRVINILGDVPVFKALVALMIQFSKAACADANWLEQNPYMVKQKMLELPPRFNTMVRYRYRNGELNHLITLMKEHQNKFVNLIK